jgi:hypothetical protein
MALSVMLAASDYGVKPVAYYEGLADRLHEAAIVFR